LRVGGIRRQGVARRQEIGMGAFAERVTRRFRVSPNEVEYLQRLEAKPVLVRRGHSIVEEGDRAEHAFVLLSGWAMSCTRFHDGSHQARRLHFSGDLMGMPSVPMRHHAEDLEAISDVLIAPFPKAMLAELFNMPRLAAIMYMFAQAERITAGDRLACVGHNSARQSLAFLIVDILHRLRSADATVGDSFPMHLTRAQIAQVIGTTPVHASRIWCSLLADNLIRCQGRTLTVVDEQRLIELSQYRDCDGDFDYEWLRQVNAPEWTGGAALTFEGQILPMQ
jgi:CRP/FNR family transcriptional regulator, anaerobic regulatory protein